MSCQIRWRVGRSLGLTGYSPEWTNYKLQSWTSQGMGYYRVYGFQLVTLRDPSSSACIFDFVRQFALSTTSRTEHWRAWSFDLHIKFIIPWLTDLPSRSLERAGDSGRTLDGCLIWHGPIREITLPMAFRLRLSISPNNPLAALESYDKQASNIISIILVRLLVESESLFYVLWLYCLRKTPLRSRKNLYKAHRTWAGCAFEDLQVIQYLVTRSIPLCSHR